MLKKLYTEAKDVTVFSATDSGFGPFQDVNAFPLNDTYLARAALQYCVVEGKYSTHDITHRAKYVPTKLTNTSWANLSGGKQIGILLEEGGKKTYTAGQGGTANITEGVRSSPLNLKRIQLQKMISETDPAAGSEIKRGNSTQAGPSDRCT